jgi:hypothetical protein
MGLVRWGMCHVISISSGLSAVQVPTIEMYCSKSLCISFMNFTWRSDWLMLAVDVKRNTYGSYKSLPWVTSWELSENDSCVSRGDYFAWWKWGIAEQQEWFSQGYLYFRWNLKAYGGKICIPLREIYFIIMFAILPKMATSIGDSSSS